MPQKLLQGPVGPMLFRFLLPMLAGNIFQQLYSAVDAIIIGRTLGEGALGAIGVSQPIVSIVVSLLIGMGMGAEILLGRAIGLNDGKRIRDIMDTLFTGIMLLSCVLAAAGFYGTGTLLAWIDTPSDIVDQASEYLRLLFLGIPAIAGYNTLGGLIRATGNSKVPLVFLTIAVTLNIGLDVIAVCELHMGVAGAAAASVLSEAVSLVLCWWYINHSRKSLISYHPGNILFSWRILGEGLRCGIPASIQQCAMSVGMLLLQKIVNRMDTQAIAAYTIGCKIDSFAALPITNIAQGLTIFTAQNLSAGNRERVREAKKVSLIWAWGIGAALLAVLWLSGDSIALFFGAKGETVTMTVAYIRTISLGYIMAAYHTVVLGLIRGTGNTLVPMVITIAGCWAIRLPAAALLGQQFGYMGVWSSILVSWGFCFIATLVFYRSRTFRRTLEYHSEGR